jgi:hypothetical protein
MFNLGQPTQTNPNPQQPQPNQNAYAAQLSYQGFIQCIDGVNQLQAQPEMQNLIIILRSLQEESLNCMTKACSQDLNRRESITSNESSEAQANLSRFKAIKDKNHDLLIKVLNLREKMVHQMYMYKVSSPTNDNELDQLSEKIRHLKIRVNNKYTQLKFLKMSKEGRKVTKKQQSSYSELKVPLDDLKKGAEVIEK